MVDAEIIQCAAARSFAVYKILAAKAVDKRPVAASEANGARMVDLAERAAVDQSFGCARVGTVEKTELDVERFPAGCGGVQHGLAVIIASGQRLFTIDMLAGLQRLNGG